MAYGTGPQALVNELQTRWTASRTGRDDVPDVVRDGNGNPSSDPDDADPSADERVVILDNLSEVSVTRQVVDTVHVYHPEASPGSITDRGYKEQRVVETVQIDIDLVDRTDYDATERLSAKERMVGTRAGLADTGDPPYGGIAGEVKYVLEELRRGFDEYQRVDYEPVNVSLDHADAFVAFSVDLHQLAANTVV